MSFDYHEPSTLDEAISLLGEHGDDATLLAGGTSFTLLWQLGLARPGHVVGLRRLQELREIRVDADGLWLGALATHAEVAGSPLVQGVHPVVATTFGRVATVRIRNQATVGGSLAHADPAQDPPPTLVALDAVAVVAGPGGARREVPLEAFFVGYLETVLEPTEVLLGVRVPPATPGTVARYHKFLPRTVDDYCTVSVAAALRVEDGRVAALRVALGGAGATVVRATGVEEALRGQEPTAAALREAAAGVHDEVEPFDDHRGSAAYKRAMAQVWVERVLAGLALPEHAAAS